MYALFVMLCVEKERQVKARTSSTSHYSVTPLKVEIKALCSLNEDTRGVLMQNTNTNIL